MGTQHLGLQDCLGLEKLGLGERSKGQGGLSSSTAPQGDRNMTGTGSATLSGGPECQVPSPTFPNSTAPSQQSMLIAISLDSVQYDKIKNKCPGTWVDLKNKLSFPMHHHNIFDTNLLEKAGILIRS